ncbi:tyrosine-type recombinase/integrase [Dehalococcoides mccartyi]|uniref:Site-specific recombinase, phage integrase family n=1 Tax=Dehalococcoides mccartyi (strain ATCC BAA-2266 / KCTC 15142 / 195) TaxID=243164 RepID=Q3Z6H5_DEHM1|nr:site-specific integrase [Dehalococcoides mccartyi]AAW39345.1 site-specific recombinase, phage integrase family [Dehalococcoides mccartyi 195]
MRGAIIKRGNSYRVKISLGKDSASGKYLSHYETVKGNKKAAEKRLNELIHQFDSGTFVKPGKSTMYEYMQSWLNDYCKPNLSPRTVELYSYISTKHIIPTLGNIPIVELKPQHLQHLYADKQSFGLSNRTVQIIHVVLHKALKNAVKTGLLSRNIAEAVDAPKIQRHEMQVMNESDMQVLLEKAKETPYYALFYTSLFTGMRRAECLALRWSDIDLILCQVYVLRSMQYVQDADLGKRITFKEPKTSKSRRQIALSPSNVIILREHYQDQSELRKTLNLPGLTDSDLVFSHYDGSPLLPNSVTHAWIKLARRCGLNGIRLHDARHTHASLLLKQGVHPKIVQERLGHGSIQITLDTYSHVAPGLQQAAASKFDDIVLAGKRELVEK